MRGGEGERERGRGRRVKSGGGTGHTGGEPAGQFPRPDCLVHTAGAHTPGYARGCVTLCETPINPGRRKRVRCLPSIWPSL